MAIYRSNNVTVHRPSVTADDSDTVSARGEFVLTAPLVAGDVVELVKLPAGTKIVDAILDSSAAIGAGTVSDSAGAVVLLTANAATSLGAGVDRLDSPAAIQAPPLPTESVIVFVAGAGGGAVGDVIGLTVQYRNQRYGN